MGIDTAHMVDDWMTVGTTEDEAREKLTIMEETLISAGFYLSQKTKLSQKEVLLGVLLDTTTMTMRFDATQAQGTRILLEQQLTIIAGNKHPDTTIIRHICGKLNWYAEVIQSGRLHLAYWWQYERHGRGLFPKSKQSLVADTQWWINILRVWETGESSSLSYPMLSTHRLFNKRRSVYVLHSDASGTDGHGFHGSFLEDEAQEYHSYSWTNTDQQCPQSSHAAELAALAQAIEELTTPQRPPIELLIWVSDSQSAVYSINKGTSRKSEGYNVLSHIMEMCDTHRITIAGLWIPREENQLADYLSHLSHSLNRAHVSGSIPPRQHQGSH